MSEKLKAKYMQDPSKCPYCGSFELEGRQSYAHDMALGLCIYVSETCLSCSKAWRLAFALNDVIPNIEETASGTED